MKFFNAEKAINSQLKFLFMLIWIATLVFLIIQGKPNTGIQLHPWLAGIAETKLTAGLEWVVAARCLFIAGSTIVAWLISVRQFDISRKDYMLFFILPVIHFTIADWSIGLMASIYWTVFLMMLFLLLPNETTKPDLRKTLTAAIFSGILLLNGAFAVLYFAAGIIIMTVFQTISFRTALIWIMGFLSPSFFLLFWYFMNDRIDVILQQSENFFLSEELMSFSFPPVFYICPALLFLLVVIAHSRMNENKISVRRSYSSLLFSLIVLSPAVFTSFFNVRILFSLYGLATVFYWIRIIYTTRRRIPFILLWLMPVVLPVLYYFLLEKF